MARRRRHDPDDVAIDGDPSFTDVKNKDPNKLYALVSQDDMPRLVNRGYTRTIASADGPKPAYGIAKEDGSEIVVNGQLVLMEAPREIGEAAQRKGEIEFAQRSQGLQETIKAHIRDNPGVRHEYKVNENYRSAG